jgi:glycogen synthase
VVLIEAMAAGCPVVASDIDGYRNVATDGDDALLVPPNDERALAAALDRVLSDATLAETLRQRGVTRSRRFSMAEQADAYLRIYREVLDDRASQSRRSDDGSSPGLVSARFYARVRRWSALLVGLARRMLRR